MIGLITDDEMVDHFDFEEFARLNEMIGQILVIFGRCHIPTGMVPEWPACKSPFGRPLWV